MLRIADTEGTICENLIVNGNEKYRLVINGDLKYAKGLVIMDLNIPKDGSGKKILYTYTGEKSYYVFYEQGFYTVGGEGYYYGPSIKHLIPYSNYATFNGWYTKKTNGTKIETIQDLNNYTTIFQYSSSSTIPTVTLYANWTVKTTSIFVHNITRSSDVNGNHYSSTSSFEYRLNTNTTRYSTSSGTIEFQNVLIGTDVIDYLNDHIRNPKYVSWAKQYSWPVYFRNSSEYTGVKETFGIKHYSGIDNFLNGEWQPFYGWHTVKFGMDRDVTTSYILTPNNINWSHDFYPQFDIIIIWTMLQDSVDYENHSKGYVAEDHPYAEDEYLNLLNRLETIASKMDNSFETRSWKHTWEWDYRDMARNYFDSFRTSAATILIGRKNWNVTRNN